MPYSRCCAALYCAPLLCWAQGKVRAISFDQQQQQVVALATDCSLSWWSPDLMLRGSARMGVQEPVALAVNGPVVAIGGDGSVLLLDIREPCGTKRSHSSSGDSPTHKRSRLHDGAGSSRQPHAFGPPDAAAAAEGAAADAGVLSGWLPPAYPWLRLTAARPMVLAVTGSLPGMQGLQNTSAAAGVCPVRCCLVSVYLTYCASCLLYWHAGNGMMFMALNMVEVRVSATHLACVAGSGCICFFGSVCLCCDCHELCVHLVRQGHT
jgi:hypothetical protein